MRDRQNRAGKFFLKIRGDIWYICHYDSTTRQTVSLSTGLSDREAARKELLEHAIKADRPKVDTDAQLAAILQRYYVEYASTIASAHVQKNAQADALDIWGDVNVSDLTRAKQLEFVAVLREREYSDWTIQARLGRVWAAMNWFHRDHTTLIVPAMITTDDWKPLLEDRDQTYTPEEFGRLLKVCDSPDAPYSRAHWRRLLILGIATASRITALRELKWDQVNLEVGRIKLNPEGRRQTKKRRATVPICPTLAAELREWQRADAAAGIRCEYVAHFYGKPIKTREFYDTMSRAAGVTGGPNVIRHSVRTWLADMGVPDPDADLFMGHKDEGSATGGRYKHRRPEFLRSVSQALELLFDAVQEHVEVPVGGRSALEDQPLPGDVFDTHLSRAEA